MSDRKRILGRTVRPAALLAAAALFACAGLNGTSSAPPAARPAPGGSPSATPAAGRPASAPASAAVAWADPGKRVKIQYPGDWRPKHSPDYELMLLPPGASGDDRRITVDVPDLPPHLPFMIRMSRVEHDYVQDLRKDHADLQVKESAEVNVPEATAKFVRCGWRQNGADWDDVALLLIHASGVYILDARTDDGRLAPTRAAFDAIRASLVWTKH